MKQLTNKNKARKNKIRNNFMTLNMLKGYKLIKIRI